MTELDHMVRVKERLEGRIKLSEAMLVPMGITVEAFQRVALNALLANRDLGECTPESLDMAVIECIGYGLLPDGFQAKILAFNKQAQLIPMIGGRLMLARKATPGLSLRTRVVYSDDHFKHEEGLRPILEHRIKPEGAQNDSDLIAAYAVAEIPGAPAPEFEVHYRSTLDTYRARSSSSGHRRSGWNTAYPEMCKKTVLGQLLKRLPRQVSDPPDTDTDGRTESSPENFVGVDGAPPSRDTPEEPAKTGHRGFRDSSSSGSRGSEVAPPSRDTPEEPAKTGHRGFRDSSSSGSRGSEVAPPSRDTPEEPAFDSPF